MEILRILVSLALLPDMEVHVISGRRRDDMELWLGSLPVGLHAEHGLWSRPAASEQWTRRDVKADWIERVRPVMAQYAEAVPGSIVEEKDASIAWHYRRVPIGTGRREAAALTRALETVIAQSSATIVEGSRVIEVRDAATDKGRVVNELVAASPGARLLVMGDDVTDEDMFRAAPGDAVTVKVGVSPTAAAMRLMGPDQVRVVLTEIVTTLDLRVHPDRSGQPQRTSETTPGGEDRGHR
jgi:trehalose 6-phosphate synthase/phosphatase